MNFSSVQKNGLVYFAPLYVCVVTVIVILVNVHTKYHRRRRLLVRAIDAHFFIAIFQQVSNK